MSNTKLVGREVWRGISKKYQADLSSSLIPLSFTACFEVCSWQYPPALLVTRGKGVFISPVEVGKPALWVWGGWIQRRRDLSIQWGWWCWCYWSSLPRLLLSGVKRRANKQHETQSCPACGDRRRLRFTLGLPCLFMKLHLNTAGCESLQNSDF